MVRVARSEQPEEAPPRRGYCHWQDPESICQWSISSDSEFACTWPWDTRGRLPPSGAVKFKKFSLTGKFRAATGTCQWPGAGGGRGGLSSSSEFHNTRRPPWLERGPGPGALATTVERAGATTWIVLVGGTAPKET